MKSMEGGGPMKGEVCVLFNSLDSLFNYSFKNFQPQGSPIFLD